MLAAGRRHPHQRYLAGNPKCTVDIGGQKLIQYTIELFHKKGITDIAMVLGYRAEVIQETLKDYEGIRYFYNPSSTSPTASPRRGSLRTSCPSTTTPSS